MGKHALLSASSSKRWLSCTPSARLEEQFRDEPGGSVYDEEGTAAHALAEHKLKKALRRRSKRPVSDYHCDEMEECTDGYVAFAMEQVELARQECSDPVVLVEQRLDYSAYVPEGFGTGDLLIVADKVLTVIDLKYGKGVAVDAEWNPQMMLYGLGALELFDALYDIEMIRMTIYQPRKSNISVCVMEKDGLLEWAQNDLTYKAKLAYEGGGDFHCGEWCRFCKAKAECRERAEANLALARYDFEEPPLLTDEEIAGILDKVDALTAWAADVKEYALQQAVSGTAFPGWKLVEGRSNRKYTSEAAVAAAVEGAGFNPYEKKLLGITAMQKLLGKSRFEELLAPYIEKPQGRPTLVRSSDKRPEWNTAKNDFMEEM